MTWGTEAPNVSASLWTDEEHVQRMEAEAFKRVLRHADGDTGIFIIREFENLLAAHWIGQKPNSVVQHTERTAERKYWELRADRRHAVTSQQILAENAHLARTNAFGTRLWGGAIKEEPLIIAPSNLRWELDEAFALLVGHLVDPAFFTVDRVSATAERSVNRFVLSNMQLYF